MKYFSTRILLLSLVLLSITFVSCSLLRANCSSPSIDLQGFGITPQDYGAIGNGKADDTRAFEAVLREAQESGRSVMIPVGKYKITRTLVLNSRVTLIGENEPNTIIIYAPIGKNSGPCMAFRGGKETENSRIEHIRFQMQTFGVNQPNVHTIVFDNSSPSRLILNDVCFLGFTGYGFYLTGETTYGQNIALTNLSFYRMGGLIGQSDDRGMKDWWVNLIILSNIHLDAYSGHSVNLTSPQKYLVDLRGWRMVNITNLLIEGAIQKPSKVMASVRLGGGYSPEGSNYLGLGNVTITGFWEEFSSESKPHYTFYIETGISSISIRDFTARSFEIDADALALRLSGKRFSVLAQADQYININGNATVILEDILSTDGNQSGLQKYNARKSKLQFENTVQHRH